MSPRSTFECFGLVIHGCSLKEIFERIADSVLHATPVVVVTANPEILLEARRNPTYWNILRQAEIRLVDGFGLQLVGFLNGAKPKRIAGVEVAEALLQESVKRGWRVAMLGGDPGNADKAAWKIRQAYPELSIFAERGGEVSRDGHDDDVGESMRFRLTQFAPDVLLVGFGHPEQEAWIARYLSEFPTVKVAIGIGGTIDYWSGAKKRAPVFFQTLGLEWLWRVIKEPKRWKRILNAVIVFPLAAFQDKLFSKNKTS